MLLPLDFSDSPGYPASRIASPHRGGCSGLHLEPGQEPNGICYSAIRRQNFRSPRSHFSEARFLWTAIIAMEPPEKLMGGGAKAGASCQSCRRRKLRCSKERPACEGCRYRGTTFPILPILAVSSIRVAQLANGLTDVDCVYSSRGKPGMRPGAIESLQNRIGQSSRLVTVLRRHLG